MYSIRKIRALISFMLGVALFAVGIFCSLPSSQPLSEWLVPLSAENASDRHLVAQQSLIVTDTTGQFQAPLARTSSHGQLVYESLPPSSQPSARTAKHWTPPQADDANHGLLSRATPVLPARAIVATVCAVTFPSPLLPSAGGLVVFPTPPPYDC